MKMTRFRIQNYKKIEDSGWISCGDLTTFVGKNEAGKSALFRALSKLNPSDGERYNGLKEFPRKRYTSEFENNDWNVVTVEFELNKAERNALQSINPIFSETTTVTCRRRYSGDFEVTFNPGPATKIISNREFRAMLGELEVQIQDLIAPDGKGDKIKAFKELALKHLSELETKISKESPDEGVAPGHVDNLLNFLLSNMNESWQKELLNPLKQRLTKAKEVLNAGAKITEGESWIKKNMPVFVYFGKYDVLDSAINIPTFIQQLKQQPSAPRVRATKCLFEHVGLDIDEIMKLNPASSGQNEEQKRDLADERAIQMSSASTSMTATFSDWWEQRKHKFHYKIDGDFFRVWISDDLDPSEIELDQRSMGLQYFFSFYIVFLVEAERTHKNAILLLDEPGLHMHGTAQAKIVKFLEDLSKKNQTLYTTHSPFMIDGDKLEQIRVVYEEKDGTTKVSEDVWPKDKDALFPLQAALGYSITQTLFYAKRQIIVEGITDYQIFKAIDRVLKTKGMKGLREDAVLIPAGGVTNLVPLASMLLGHRVKVAAILDGDEPARNKGRSLHDKLLSGKKNVCVFVGDHLPNKVAELEDIFPETFYLETVEKSYDGKKIAFTAKEKKIPNISKRVASAFGRLNMGKFEKWLPVAAIIEMIENDPDQIPNETLEIFSQIFSEANKLL